jgi:hypothetical protein
MEIFFSTRLEKLDANGSAARPLTVRTLPIRTTVMGEQLAWDLSFKIESDKYGKYRYKTKIFSSIKKKLI